MATPRPQSPGPTWSTRSNRRLGKVRPFRISAGGPFLSDARLVVGKWHGKTYDWRTSQSLQMNGSSPCILKEKSLNRSKFRVLAVAASALAAASLMAAPAAANAAGGTYYPSGPQVNVPLSTVTNGGWTLCWSEDIGHAGPDHLMELADIMAGTADGSVTPCGGARLMLTGWDPANPGVLPVLAAAPRSAILTETPVQVTPGELGRPVTFTPTTIQANGSQWYNYPGLAMGFRDGGDPAPPLWAWDIEQPLNSLSWFLLDRNAGNQMPMTLADLSHVTQLGLGGSMGALFGNSESHGFTMAIFTQNTVLHKGSKTNASSLARTLRMSTPAGGSLVVSVSDASSPSCRVDNNKLYAFGAGTCEVTVTSLKANGNVKATKSISYSVN